MKFKISVPATSANVGPGFDMMGLAFDMFNRFTFETGGDGLSITGCEPQFASAENNLVYKTLEKTLQSYGRPVPAMNIHFDTDLPLCSGLGSSSTCIVAGIMAANQIGGLNFDKGEILRIASLIEGHPDNVAPAILGGFVAAIIENDFVYWHEYSISDKLSFYALMPDVRVSTEEARKILPKSYSLSDCIYNLSRVPLLVEGLEKADEQLIRAGCKDRLHQSYRLSLIPEGDKVFNYVKESDNAVTTYVSGAGPTIVAIVVNDDDSFGKEIADYCDTLSLNWRVRKMHVNHRGASIKIIRP
ncbi:MAG: homoserine kinase [Verrucomicrobia bacterium]|nr:homoserine kinase [Verrucomicrobiota bacterium]MBR6797813.1 homoserine kinase [Opitutales bacterium]